MLLLALALPTALAVPAPPGFYPYWELSTPTASWSLSFPTSDYKEPVVLRECETTIEKDDDDVFHTVGDGTTFVFDEDGYWRTIAEAGGEWTSEEPPCDDTMSDRRCIEEVLEHTDRDLFCFEPGIYEQGCYLEDGSERDSDECNYTKSGDPDEEFGWSAPIVINRSRMPGEPVLQIRNIELDDIEHPSHNPSERADLKMPLFFKDVLNDSGATGEPSWIVHGLSFRELSHLDRIPMHYEGYCEPTPWDHTWWFNLAQYDNPGSTKSLGETYEGGGEFWGYGYSYQENKGRNYSGFYSATIMLQCTSDVYLSHLEMLDNDHLNSVYFRGRSHRNAVQSSVMGYTDEFVLAHRDELTDWLDDYASEFPTGEDELTIGAPVEGEWSEDDLIALTDLRTWRGAYPEHEFFQDGVCVMFQSRQGHGGGVELRTAEDNRVIENEFINCNDGVHIQQGSGWIDTQAAESVPGFGVWDADDAAWWSVYPGTVIENNDLYLTRALYTDCSGNPVYDAMGGLIDATTDEDRLCSISENAMDFKAGGWLPLEDVTDPGNWPFFDAAEVKTAAEDQVQVLRNRMWGYRQSDPMLSVRVGTMAGDVVWLPNSNRQDAGYAVGTHMNANGIAFIGNVIADSVGGIGLTNSTPTWGTPRPPAEAFNYLLALNNLIADAAWLADPEARWGAVPPRNSNAFWDVSGGEQAWVQSAGLRQSGPSVLSCNTVLRTYGWLYSDALDSGTKLRGNVVLDGGVINSTISGDVQAYLDDNEYHSTAPLTVWGGVGSLDSPTQILPTNGWPVSTPMLTKCLEIDFVNRDDCSVPGIPTTHSPKGPTLRQLTFPNTRWQMTPGLTISGTPFSNDPARVCDPDLWNVDPSVDIFTPWLP